MLTSLFLYEARQRLKFPPLWSSLSLRLMSLFSSSKTSLETHFSGFFFLLSWRIFLLYPNSSTRTRPALYSSTRLLSFGVHFLVFFFFIICSKLILVWTDMCLWNLLLLIIVPTSHTVYRICWYHVYHCSTLIVSTCRFTEKNLTWGDDLSGQ